MRIIFKDIKRGKVKVAIDSLNDLWHLSNIIQRHDIISGSSFRIVKFSNEEEKKRIWVKIDVEKVFFSPYKDRLRIRGIIIEGKPEEFVQAGKYHSLDIGEGDIIEIKKNHWLNFEKERLKEAVEESKKPKGYVILIDERNILIAKILPYGVEVIAEEEMMISKRMSEKDIEKERKKTFENIRKLLKERFIAIGGNTWLRDMLKDYLESHGYEVKTFYAEYAEISTLNRLSEKDVLKDIVGFARMREENNLFERFLMKHLKEHLSAYGTNVFNEVKKGNIELLLLTSSMLKDDKVRGLCKEVEQMGGKVFIISDSSNAGEKLKGFGGIAAILRFKA